MPLNEEEFIARVSLRHSVSPDAVRTILRALSRKEGHVGAIAFSRTGDPATLAARLVTLTS